MATHPDLELATPENEYNMQSEPRVVERSLWDDCMLEAVGMAFFVYISLSGVHQAVFTALGSASAVNEIHVALCFMLGLSAGITIALKSGAHLNCAVSFALFVFGSISFKRFIAYTSAQMIGAFLAALLVLAVNDSRINNLADDHVLMGAYGTLRNPANSLFSTIIDQIIGTALLMVGIIKSTNTKWKPLYIGMVLGGLGLFQGSNSYAFNPSRDFAPRVASSIIYGSDPFTNQDSWFWVPMLMPFVGAPLGYVIAQLL